MEEIRFEVQGSAAEPYRLLFVRRSHNNFSAYCSCPAGENGQYCKHRFAILEGTSKGIVSSNIDDIKKVQGWLAGSDVEAAMTKVRFLEKEANKIKSELSNAKKAVAEAMRD